MKSSTVTCNGKPVARLMLDPLNPHNGKLHHYIRLVRLDARLAFTCCCGLRCGRCGLQRKACRIWAYCSFLLLA